MKWLRTLLKSVRFHRRQAYYHLTPVVWRICFNLWALDFMGRRVTWEWPTK